MSPTRRDRQTLEYLDIKGTPATQGYDKTLYSALVQPPENEHLLAESARGTTSSLGVASATSHYENADETSRQLYSEVVDTPESRPAGKAVWIALRTRSRHSTARVRELSACIIRLDGASAFLAVQIVANMNAIMVRLD